MSTWKHVERQLAKLVSGRRVPVTGRQRGDAPDIEHEWLALEVKHRKQLPEWLLDALRQAEACNQEGKRLPVALLHQKGQPYRDSLAVIRLKDFMNWFGQ